MIKNVLFDMGGVVFLQDTAEAFRRFRAAGINPDLYMGAHGQKDFFLDVETGKIDAAEFCRRMAAAAGKASVSWEEAQHCWLGFIREVPVSRLRFLTELRKTYRLCLLSNTNPFIMAFTRSSLFSQDGLPITDYFDALFCSYEMMAYKPDAAFFEKALQQGGMKAGECLFLDDSITNIKAAEAVGIKGFHVAQDEDWTVRLPEALRTLNAI